MLSGMLKQELCCTDFHIILVYDTTCPTGVSPESARHAGWMKARKPGAQRGKPSGANRYKTITKKVPQTAEIAS